MQTIVIGHKNPDMDSICPALAYAELKRLTGHENVLASRFVSSSSRYVSPATRYEENRVWNMSQREKPREVVCGPLALGSATRIAIGSVDGALRCAMAKHSPKATP